MQTNEIVIIALISVFIVVSAVLISRFLTKNKQQKQEMLEPKLDDPQLSLFESPAEAEVKKEAQKDVLLQPKAQNRKASPVRISSKNVQPQDIISLYVIAKDQGKFSGYELLQALLAAGLRYGDMKIFHRYQETSGQGKTLFSLASATEPGYFDLQNMGAHCCQGLCLFMDINNVDAPQEVFDLLLSTAEQLADGLEGEIFDSQRQPLEVEFIAKVRRHIRDSRPATNYESDRDTLEEMIT